MPEPRRRAGVGMSAFNAKLEAPMRSIPIGMTALALLSAAASAQTPQTAPSRSNTMMPGQSATAIPVKPAPAINPLNQEDVSWIAGTTVNGGDDAKVGHVSAV